MFRPLVLACVAALSLPLAAAPLGTAFTYQGRLADAGQPATDLYDFEFCLFDASAGGATLGCASQGSTADVPVEDGFFTTMLDFGAAAFAGEKRYLELRVRPGSSGSAFEVLAPRQLMTATPESLRSMTSAQTPWSGLTGIPAGFADGTDDGGGVSAITAGTGLFGGTINSTGTIGIADGGVGLAQIDTVEVQVRITGSCPAGSYLRAVSDTGGVTCESLPGLPAPSVVSVTSGPSVATISIAMGSDGLPAVSYVDLATDDLKFIKCPNASCSGPVTVRTLDSVGLVGEFSSLAMRSDNIPVIAYFDRTQEALKIATCGNSECSSAPAIQTFHAGTVSPEGLSLALRSGNEPSIAFISGITQLRLMDCSTPACGFVTVSLLDTGSPRSPAVAIGPDNVALVSYHDSASTSLKTAKCAGIACGSPIITTIESAGNAGNGSSLAFDFAGLPAISYHADSAVKLARCTTVDCSGATQTAVLDANAGAGTTTTSLAFAPSGNPFVSYFDVPSASPKVAHCFSPNCGSVALAILDSIGTAGDHNDALIGADGLPLIAYRSGINVLRVAKCNTSSCQ